MVLKNCTTIEMFEKSRATPWPYDHGWRRNFQEVFGRRCSPRAHYNVSAPQMPVRPLNLAMRAVQPPIRVSKLPIRPWVALSYL